MLRYRLARSIKGALRQHGEASSRRRQAGWVGKRARDAGWLAVVVVTLSLGGGRLG